MFNNLNYEKYKQSVINMTHLIIKFAVVSKITTTVTRSDPEVYVNNISLSCQLDLLNIINCFM